MAQTYEASLVKDHERVDDLQRDGLKIIQNPEGFCFGIDAVLLSHFAKAKKGETIVELGTGTGIIPILLSAKTENTQIHAFEVQPEMADMAGRSVKLNQLEERIHIIEDNLKNFGKYFGKSTVDVVVTNPPYMADAKGIQNDESMLRISRHEVLCNLEDVIRTSAAMLKPGGSFYMVHRPMRLVDIVALMRQYKLEPKVIRLVQPSVHKKPNILLIKGVRGAKPELRFEDPLIVYDESGDYTKEIYDIYGESQISVFEKKEDAHE